MFHLVLAVRVWAYPCYSTSSIYVKLQQRRVLADVSEDVVHPCNEYEEDGWQSFAEFISRVESLLLKDAPCYQQNTRSAEQCQL